MEAGTRNQDAKYLSLNNSSGSADYTSVDDRLVGQIARARAPAPPPRPVPEGHIQPEGPPTAGPGLSKQYKLIIIALLASLFIACVVIICTIVTIKKQQKIHDLTKDGHIKGCDASNEHRDFECQYVYENSADSGAGHEWSTNGRGALGEWLQIDFHHSHVITGINLLQRCSRRQQIKSFKLYFDDDSTQEVEIQCLDSDPSGARCANLQWQSLNIDQEKSSYVRLVITGQCDKDTEYAGIREIEIYGF